MVASGLGEFMVSAVAIRDPGCFHLPTLPSSTHLLQPQAASLAGHLPPAEITFQHNNHGKRPSSPSLFKTRKGFQSHILLHISMWTSNCHFISSTANTELLVSSYIPPPVFPVSLRGKFSILQTLPLLRPKTLGSFWIPLTIQTSADYFLLILP